MRWWLPPTRNPSSESVLRLECDLRVIMKVELPLRLAAACGCYGTEIHLEDGMAQLEHNGVFHTGISVRNARTLYVADPRAACTRIRRIFCP